MLHSSEFLLTVNTNKQYTGDDLYNASNAMRHAFNELKDNLGDFVEFGYYHTRNNNNSWSPINTAKWNRRFVKEAETVYTIEQGPLLHRLHAHAHIKILHYTSLRLSTKKLRTHFSSKLGNFVGNIYLNIAFVPNNHYIKNYVRK